MLIANSPETGEVDRDGTGLRCYGGNRNSRHAGSCSLDCCGRFGFAEFRPKDIDANCEQTDRQQTNLPMSEQRSKRSRVWFVTASGFLRLRFSLSHDFSSLIFSCV